MENNIEQIKLKFKRSTIVEKIIYVNVAIFIFGFLFKTLNFLMSTHSNLLFDWFALPADYNELIYKPWTIFTYAFLHAGIWHILSNMLVLYYVGNLFLDYFTQKQFLNYYILGALGGGIIFVLSYNLFPAFKNTNSILLGASAAVTAIFVGITTYIPHYEIKIRFLGFIKLWYLAAIWVGLDVIQIPVENSGGHLAHLGGAIIGFLLTYEYQKGGNFIELIKNIFKQKKQNPLKTVYKSTKRTKTESPVVNQKRIDDILDKIGKSGYETLTKEEKDFLFKSAKS